MLGRGVKEKEGNSDQLQRHSKFEYLIIIKIITNCGHAKRKSKIIYKL